MKLPNLKILSLDELYALLEKIDNDDSDAYTLQQYREVETAIDCITETDDRVREGRGFPVHH